MKIDRFNRRLFLQGTGGLMFAVPALPSLLGESQALSAPASSPRFIVFHHNYGVFDRVFFPMLGGTVAPGPLPSGQRVREYRLSDVLQHSKLFAPIGSIQSLKDKIVILNGIDKLGYVNHKSETVLCGGYNGRGPYGESIDQIMARSGKVYAAEPLYPTFHLGSNHHRNKLSWKKDGETAVPLVQHSGPGSALNYIFSNLGSTPEAIATKKAHNLSILDLIRDDYADLLRSDKLSREDKTRLARHLELTRDLEQRISRQQLPVCPDPDLDTLKGGGTLTATHIHDMFFIAETLIKCNLTKIITISHESGYLHNLSHANKGDGTSQGSIDSHHRLMTLIAEEVGNFLQNLDVAESGGNTHLDNSLFWWSTDMGSHKNHTPVSIPQLLAGGKGILNTGKYLDYRGEQKSRHARGWAGHPMNQLQISIMLAMGLSPSDWEVGGTAGFGSYAVSGYDTNYENFNFGDKRSPLPKLFT